MQLHFAFHSLLLRILSSRLFSMQGIHIFLATNFSSTSKYCLYSMSKCVCICWLLQCKSAVLYSSGPHLQYHSWFNKYLLWPDCMMSPCISPSDAAGVLAFLSFSLSDCNTNTPHVVLSLYTVWEQGGGGPPCSTALAWLSKWGKWCSRLRDFLLLYFLQLFVLNRSVKVYSKSHNLTPLTTKGFIHSW